VKIQSLQIKETSGQGDTAVSEFKMSLERFVKAQENSYAKALAELKAGAKRTHWMWWIFPQMRGLGSSDNAIYYGIADEAEAVAYLQHSILGPRYRECLDVVYDQLCVRGLDPLTLMDSEIDVLKLKSSLQLLGTKIEGAQGRVKETLKKL
jgi:uncharacterized protein (DUF1810 family)